MRRDSGERSIRLVKSAPVAGLAAWPSTTYTLAFGGSKVRRSGARVDSSCLAMTLKCDLAKRRSNSPSTSGCGESMQTVSFELVRNAYGVLGPRIYATNYITKRVLAPEEPTRCPLCTSAVCSTNCAQLPFKPKKQQFAARRSAPAQNPSKIACVAYRANSGVPARNNERHSRLSLVCVI